MKVDQMTDKRICPFTHREYKETPNCKTSMEATKIYQEKEELIICKHTDRMENDKDFNKGKDLHGVGLINMTMDHRDTHSNGTGKTGIMAKFHIGREKETPNNMTKEEKRPSVNTKGQETTWWQLGGIGGAQDATLETRNYISNASSAEARHKLVKSPQIVGNADTQVVIFQETIGSVTSGVSAETQTQQSQDLELNLVGLKDLPFPELEQENTEKQMVLSNLLQPHRNITVECLTLPRDTTSNEQYLQYNLLMCPVFEMIFNKTSTLWLLDTGASKSLVTPQFMKQNPHLKIYKTNFICKGANDEEIPLEGAVNLDLQIAKETYNFSFQVSKCQLQNLSINC